MTSHLKAISKKNYAVLGLIALGAAAFSLAFQLQNRFVPSDLKFLWQTISGSVLLGLMGFQWYLMRKRWTGKISRADLVSHRWVGVVVTFLFALHAARIGHTWMVGLTIVFFLTALTGVLNKEVIRFSERWMYLLWLTVHVSLSVILVPLIAIHIWVAMAYQ